MSLVPSLPALQIKDEYINASPLQAFRMGEQDQMDRHEFGRKQEQRNLLKEVGSQAAGGNYLQAAQTAMQGGDLDTGMALNKHQVDLKSADLDTRLKVHEFLLNGVQRADTPAKWQALVARAGGMFGRDLTGEYGDFSSRPNAMTVLQEAELALQQQKADQDSQEHDLRVRKYRSEIDPYGARAGAVRTYGGDLSPEAQAQYTLTGDMPKATGADFMSVPGVGLVRTQGGQAEIAIPAPESSGKGLESAKYEQQLRKERSQLAGDFRSIADGYGRVRAGSDLDSGVGDIAIIYGYMKLLDPGSVVREGEFATAEQTAGLPQQVISVYNKLVTGERLTSSMRDQFAKAAGALYGQKSAEMKAIDDRFGSIAERYGVPRENVIMPLGVSAPDEGTGDQSQPQPKQAPDGKWYVPDPSRPGKFLRVDP